MDKVPFNQVMSSPVEERAQDDRAGGGGRKGCGRGQQQRREGRQRQRRRGRGISAAVVLAVQSVNPAGGHEADDLVVVFVFG